MCKRGCGVHSRGHVDAWAKSRTKAVVPVSPITRPGPPRGGERIPAPGDPPGGIPPYLKPIPFNVRDIHAILNRALRQQGPELMRILYSTWTAQADALKYQEIRNALRDGEFSQEVFDAWRLEYATMLSERMGPTLAALASKTAGIVIQGFVQVGGDARIYALFERGIAAYLGEHAASLAVNLERQQVLAIRVTLANLRERGITDPRAAARYLRPSVGLTEAGAKAVLNFREELEALGELSAAQIEHRVQNYVGRLERFRAETIAKTELSFAANGGNQYAAEAARASGMFGDVRKRLVPNPATVCPFCEAIAEAQPADGIAVLDSFPGMTPRAPNLMAPPLHPRCYCVVAYYVTI